LQKRLNVRGHTIAYRESGQGPNLILLHGYGGSPHDWDHLVHGLTTRFRVIVPHLSSLYMDSDEKVSFRTQVEVLSEFVGRVLPEAETTHMIAASYGGALAWGLSVFDPRRIDRLILLSPMPPDPMPRIRMPSLRRVLKLSIWPQLLWLFLKTKWGQKLLPALAEHFNVGWLKKTSERFHKVTGRKVRLAVHVIHRFGWIIQKENWSYWEKRIRFIESPVCLIWGSEDKLYLENEPERLQSIFPSCRLHRIHGAGHVIAKESPTQVEAILDSFLTSERKTA
jgi:pimeloyl-ACP methyl ester carboxylesterase